MQIDFSLVVSFLSLLVAVVVAVVAIRRGFSSDDREEATQMTTLIVKLENISNGVNEIKSEMRNMKADIQELRDRLIIVEQATKSVHKRVDGLEGKDER